jgi:hypothetical protein
LVNVRAQRPPRAVSTTKPETIRSGGCRVHASASPEAVAEYINFSGFLTGQCYHRSLIKEAPEGSAQTNMSKIRSAMFVATLMVASTVGAALSIFMDSDVQVLDLASSPQIDTFELMSASKDLPSRSYAAF